MPALIDLYEAHRANRDKFEVLAFHDASVKNFEELDKKLPEIKKRSWNGKELPFPILLDSTGATIANFGITSFPTIILIDPDGKLVGEATDETLEKKLPPLPISVRIERALERQLSCSVESVPLEDAIRIVAEEARIPVRIDKEALKRAGVSPTDPVPLNIAGQLSLRSWLNLLLEPHRLTFAVGADSLLVVPRAAGQGPPPQESDAQRSSFKRIEASLQQRASFDFKEKPLAAVAAYFEKLTGENFVLAPAAIQDGTLDPKAKVTGKADNKPIWEALSELLRPMNLKYVIRDELVVISPADGERR